MTNNKTIQLPPGSAPIAVIMISLNEAQNMDAVIANLKGWAQEIFLVDSYSSDQTVDIALSHGVHVIQRPFQDFGNQWNFAVRELPVTAPWTMKLDPDERLTDELKHAITTAIAEDIFDGLVVTRKLWFLNRPLPVTQDLMRIWRTGTCKFSDVAVNEHPIVEGRIGRLDGILEHFDSPTLHHWYEKQNRYSTMEAAMQLKKASLAAKPRLFGSALQRRMWLKRNRYRLPLRNLLMFFYCWLVQGGWRAGWTGWHWARLRAEVYRMIDLKAAEMKQLGKIYTPPPSPTGSPHPGAVQVETRNKT